MEITDSVVVDRPVPVVFAAWSELERIPQWYVDSIERRKTSEGPIGVGTTYHAVDKIPLGVGSRARWKSPGMRRTN